MQDKSCFNFTKIDEPMMDELARLTRMTVECFQQDL
jgi:hypothetical protein